MKGVMVEQVDNDDKDIIDERSNVEEDGPDREESWDYEGGDEDLPLLPLEKFSKSSPLSVW